MCFEEWMNRVDWHFFMQFGLGSQDFEDWNWYDLFEDELTPKEAFEDFVENNLEEFDSEDTYF